jgi:hypothetical protein
MESMEDMSGISKTCKEGTVDFSWCSCKLFSSRAAAWKLAGSSWDPVCSSYLYLCELGALSCGPFLALVVIGSRR